MIYRLATSPGRRALLGLRSRRGAIVRPLLALGRAEVAASWPSGAGLPFRDDPTNAEPLYARNRIRNEVLPVLREIGPEAEATIAETQAELEEEGEALERLAAEALARLGRGDGGRDRPRRPGRARPRAPPARPAAAGRAGGGRARGAGPRAGPREIWRLVNEPEGGIDRAAGGSRGADRAGPRPLRRRRAAARARRSGADGAGRVPLRRLGGAGRARAGRAIGGGTRSRRARPRPPSAARSRSGPGARATG